MVKLSRVKLAKRSLLLTLGIIFLLGGVFAAAKMIKTSKVDAAESVGRVVVNSPDDTWIMYRSAKWPWPWNGEDDTIEIDSTINLSTPRIKITERDNVNVNYDAYCVDASLKAPSGRWNVYEMTNINDPNIIDTYNEIKMAVFLSSVYRDVNDVFEDKGYKNTVKSIVNSWFTSANPSTVKWDGDAGSYWEDYYTGTFPNIQNLTGKEDYVYLMTHLAVSYLLHGDIHLENQQVAAGDMRDIDLYKFFMDNNNQYDQPDMNFINAIKNDVHSMITNPSDPNHELWLIAQNYTLYGIRDPNIDSSQSNYQNVVWIEDGNPTSGSITVHKCDKELESTCDTSAVSHSAQGGGSLEGIEFSVANASGSRIYNPFDGNFYDNGAVMATSTTNNKGIATFSNLPVGVNYTVTETASNASYILPTGAEATRSVNNLTTNGAKVGFSDYIKRGDVKFVKTDEDGGTMANVAFSITAANGESHKVVSNPSGIVNTSTSFIPHTTNTNGYDPLTSNSLKYHGYGTWFYGVASDTGAPVDNDRGALPYGNYTITELECDANKYCRDVESTTRTFIIDANNQTVDKGTIKNNCADFSLETSASDNVDDDKFVLASDTAEIKDTVSYCLKEGLEYTITGVLMDKTTGEELKINGQSITASKTFTPDAACDTENIIFSFDASELAGQDIVVYESLYHGDELLAEHKDIDDASQTITIISLGTTAADSLDGDKFIETSADSVLEDTIAYCLRPKVEYAIHGILMDKATGEALLINGETVENEIIIEPVEEAACSTAKMEFEFDTTKLGGKEVVVFESVFLKETSDPIISHEDINDEAQTVDIINLHTYAVDASDGDKILAVNDTNAIIKDTVYYQLRVGEKYTFHGVLMNKDTGVPVEVDGHTIEKTIEFTPEESYGEFDTFYELDTTGLGGATLVIFEELYYDGEVIISHTDFENQDETVTVAPYLPETGAISKADQNHSFDIGMFSITFSAISVSGYIVFRLSSRRKFYRK